MLAIDEKPKIEAGLAQDLIAQHFRIERGHLLVGGLRVADIAQQFGTPLYIYDADVMRNSFRALSDALKGFAALYYSIKANPQPEIARIFLDEGAGIEIASLGEYARARQAGAKPQQILFAGPGKREQELATVIADGIGEIHVETFEEIALIQAIATRLECRVPVAIRLNPVAAAQGGAMRMGGKPSPFGFDEEQLPDVLAALAVAPHLELCGVHLFAGTQILDAATLLKQWQHGLDLAARVARQAAHPLRSIDLGGGLGIPYYNGDRTLDLAALRAGLPDLTAQKQSEALLRDARVIVEPGRYLAGPGGLYVMRVLANKSSRGERFIVTDGGMHHHLAASGNLGQVIKRDYPIVAPTRLDDPDTMTCAIVGPLCTPLDTLARKCRMPDLKAGDLVAVMQSGAYGLSASPSGFLSHPTPAEVLVDRGEVRPIGTRPD